MIIMIKLLKILSLSFLIFNSLLIIKSQDHYDDDRWQILHESVGISAMHMQLLYDNKVIIFDRTDFGLSNLSLPTDHCRFDPNDIVLHFDCTAHSILYDVFTNSYRALQVQTDTWCSSGSVLPDGTLIQIGGYYDGSRAIRTFTPCKDNSCDWIEFPNYLSQPRWYATSQILPDGRLFIIGGRQEFSYEFYPRSLRGGSFPPSFRGAFLLNFLLETKDGDQENNLYPFLHLLPDGNLFIFANTRSILFDYQNNRVLKEFPQIPIRDPRNYPSTGSSVLLPLLDNITATTTSIVEAEIMICGGAPRNSFLQASKHRTYLRASFSCGRLKVMSKINTNANWVMVEMPIPRVMGDMLLLPTGDVIIINGAELGVAGWENGRIPITRPIIYRPSQDRFFIMSPSSRPRMYQSTAILLPDGRVLVGGSNPHIYYNFTNVDFPTDLSLEAYSPPYLSMAYRPFRPVILRVDEVLTHGNLFYLSFFLQEYLTADVLTVRIIAPSFVTHSFSMNQRMVVLKILNITHDYRGGRQGRFNVTTMGPSTAEIAPPGYYLIFIVHAGVPSSGTWVKIE